LIELARIIRETKAQVLDMLDTIQKTLARYINSVGIVK